MTSSRNNTFGVVPSVVQGICIRQALTSEPDHNSVVRNKWSLVAGDIVWVPMLLGWRKGIIRQTEDEVFYVDLEGAAVGFLEFQAARGWVCTGAANLPALRRLRIHEKDEQGAAG